VRYREYVEDPVAIASALAPRDPAQAESWCRRALAIDPGDAAAQTLLGNLAIRRGESSEAELLLRRAVAAAPRYAPGWTSLGTLLLFTGRGEEAASCFESAIAADPLSAPPRGFLGQMHEDAGRLALAHPHYEAARRLDPGTPLYGLLEARLLWKLHRPEDARSLLAIVEANAARDLDPQEAKLREEIIEDLELWPEGPPAVQAPPESVPGGE
jgi:tetratricopeptide (TPR) repeat protein